MLERRVPVNERLRLNKWLRQFREAPTSTGEDADQDPTDSCGFE